LTKAHPAIGVKNRCTRRSSILIDELENFDPNPFTFMTMKQTPIMKFVLQPIKLPFLKARIKLAFQRFTDKTLAVQRKRL
jgi:hypothetical protein